MPTFTETPFTILLADDSEDDALLVKRALLQSGFKNPVLVVSDGEAAIEYISGQGQYADRQKYPTPVLIILDIKMPRTSGLEVLRWLRQNPRYQIVPTLILSSSGLDKDICDAY